MSVWLWGGVLVGGRGAFVYVQEPMPTTLDDIHARARVIWEGTFEKKAGRTRYHLVMIRLNLCMVISNTLTYIKPVAPSTCTHNKQ